MKPSEIAKVLMQRFQGMIKRPVHLEGPPGVGKTQLVAQAAKALGVAFRTIHAPLLQPEDYGFPVISQNRENVDFIVSREKFPVVGSDCPDKGLFLIDELSQADASAQKILANLMHEGEIHGKRLKPGWQIVSTGNRATDRAGANRLLTHLGNRITRIGVEVSLDDWTQWALANGVKPEVIAFIRFCPGKLNTFDPQAEINATPRAWADGVSAALGVVDPSLEFECFKGDVGEGAAAEFSGFLKVFRKLPSPDAIMLNPTTVEVPTDPATLFALCGALAHKTTGVNFGRIMAYVNRMDAEWKVLYVRDATKMHPEVYTSVEFIKWASGEGAKLLS
jgi:hypothetical protein